MKSVVVLFVCLLCLGSVPAAADYANPGPVGLSAMSHFELLPYLWDGVWYKHASSYDRTGDNIDRTNFLYASGGERVMMEADGPGCIYRLWITSLATNKYRLRVYFDNEPTPRVNAIWNTLYNNSISPFLSPFTGYTTGGYYCYLPMPFKHHCKVTIDNPGSDWFYYNIGYATYTDKDAVTTYTGTEDTVAARNTWNSAGNPNPTADIQTIANSAVLTPGAAVTIVDRAGPATVNSISIRVPQVVPNNTASEAILDNVRIRAYWDDETVPSVDAPMGEFFGTSLGEHTVNSLPLRMDVSSGGWYRCYFPMPFGSRARIEIRNNSGYTLSQIEWDVRIGAMPDAAAKLSQGRIGYFHAFANAEYPTTTGKDYVILHTAGRGCVVGCVVTMRGLTESFQFLEGDERIHIDGSLTPNIHGTGAEDFFNCGWYYKNGEATVQTHGCPAKIVTPTYRVSTYRHFIPDKVPYHGGVRVGLEHGDINNYNGNYTSVAYYYEVNDSSLKLTDELDVGQAGSESAHGYQVAGQGWAGTRSLAYEGDDPSTYLDDGRSFSGQCQFTMAIDPANKGVKLRRRADYSSLNQTAQVYIDGILAGTWFEPGSNTTWRDCDFEIPQSLTAGKSWIAVRIVSSSWSDFRYRAYSYISGDTAAPGAISLFGAIALPNRCQLNWVNPADPDIEGVVVRFKTSGYPTSPTDGSLAVDSREWPDTRESLIHSGLTNGVAYYYTAFAYDAAGHYSAAAHASATPRPTTCASAKQLPDSVSTTLEGKIITGVFASDACIYVGEPDRMSGIRVVHSGVGLALGDRVNVSGTLGTRVISGYPAERQITGAVVTKLSGGQPLTPLAMKCTAVGGAAVPPYLPGVDGGIGLNNMGMLVKVSGVVTGKVTSYIYLDDGGGAVDPSGTPGVLVKCPSMTIPYEIGDFVSAAGVIEASIPIGAASSRRLIRSRDWSDFVKHGP